MSHLNLKLAAAVLIFCFSLTEFLVFNEEVFLFICFFVFFNAVSTFAGDSIKQSFQEIGEDIENTFLRASKEANVGITELILKKNLAHRSIDRVLIFLKAFNVIVLQKSLLHISTTYFEKAEACAQILQRFESMFIKAWNMSAVNIDQVFAINAKNLLKLGPSLPVTTRIFFAAPKPKSSSRIADRILSQGLLTPVNRSL